MNRIFSIGNFIFDIEYEASLRFPENFLLFDTDGKGSPEYSYRISFSETLPAPEGRLIAEKEDIRIFSDNGLEERCLTARGTHTPYGFYREISESSAEIILTGDDPSLLSLDTVFSSLFALEKRLLKKEGLVLHCSFTEYRNEALLFSAPSGTGKSTQSGLWKQYRGSMEINGDRALLRKADGIWTAMGWPVCGSSEICHNTSAPVKALILLSQAKENRIIDTPPLKAYSLLYPEITVNGWNRDAVSKAMELLSDLIESVPVYSLSCDISEEAVNTLYDRIYG